MAGDAGLGLAGVEATPSLLRPRMAGDAGLGLASPSSVSPRLFGELRESEAHRSRAL
jgi:hypothetical protein